MLEAYREHVAERAAQNIPPKPLDAEQVAGLIELLKQPPAGEEDYVLESYLELHAKWASDRGIERGDMVFEPGGGPVP